MEEAITLANLAEHLKRLTFLNGPRGTLSDWMELTARLQDALKPHGLVLDYDEEEERYVVCASVLESERKG